MFTPSIKGYRMLRVALFGLVTTVLVLTGCSSAPPVSPQIAQRYQDSSFVAKVETDLRGQELGQVPDWYLYPEKSTSQTLFSVAQASSADLQIAVSKAVLIAQFRLGEQAAGVVDGQKELTASDSESSVGHNYSQYARSLVKAVDLSRASTIQQTVKIFQGKFYVYTQMSMPRPARPVVRPSALDAPISVAIQPLYSNEGDSQ